MDQKKDRTRRARTLAQLAVTFGVAYGGAVACSTVADPADRGELPDCNCPLSDQVEISCHTGIQNDVTQVHFGFPDVEAQHICVSESDTQTERETECLDACEDYIDEQEINNAECYFYDTPREFFVSCMPWGGTGGADACPGWYDPEAEVSRYQVSGGAASATVSRDFIESIRDEMFALYVCDDARYEEQSAGSWKFIDVESGALLYEIGVRSNDTTAQVQGFDPVTEATTTSAFTLDTLEHFHDAYVATKDEDGIILTVTRSGSPWEIWVTLD